MRLFYGDRAGGHGVVAVEAQLGLELLGGEQAALGDKGAGLQPTVLRRSPALVGHDVGVRVTDQLVAGRAQQPDRGLVAHRAGRDEHRGLVAEHLRNVLFQSVDRGVLAIDVVADLRLGHRAAHCRIRARNGVAA